MWKLLELQAFTSCRSVRMYAATKSFERFRQPKSVENDKKSADNAGSKSAAYKTKWSCKVFEEWKQNRLVKSYTLEPAAFLPRKTLKKLRSTNFGQGNYRYVCMQCELLTVEVRSRSKQLFWGTLSIPFVVLIICGLKRHLSDVNGSAAFNPLDMSYRICQV